MRGTLSRATGANCGRIDWDGPEEPWARKQGRDASGAMRGTGPRPDTAARALRMSRSHRRWQLRLALRYRVLVAEHQPKGVHTVVPDSRPLRCEQKALTDVISAVTATYISPCPADWMTCSALREPSSCPVAAVVANTARPQCATARTQASRAAALVHPSARADPQCHDDARSTRCWNRQRSGARE